MAHDLDKISSDLTKRVENLYRNSASQDSLTEVISRIEYLEIEKGNNRKNRSQADAGDTNQKIFLLFEILIKKQGDLEEKIRILDEKINHTKICESSSQEDSYSTLEDLIAAARGGGSSLRKT